MDPAELPNTTPNHENHDQSIVESHVSVEIPAFSGFSIPVSSQSLEISQDSDTVQASNTSREPEKPNLDLPSFTRSYENNSRDPAIQIELPVSTVKNITVSDRNDREFFSLLDKRNEKATGVLSRRSTHGSSNSVALKSSMKKKFGSSTHIGSYNHPKQHLDHKPGVFFDNTVQVLITNATTDSQISQSQSTTPPALVTVYSSSEDNVLPPNPNVKPNFGTSPRRYNSLNKNSSLNRYSSSNKPNVNMLSLLQSTESQWPSTTRSIMDIPIFRASNTNIPSETNEEPKPYTSTRNRAVGNMEMANLEMMTPDNPAINTKAQTFVLETSPSSGELGAIMTRRLKAGHNDDEDIVHKKGKKDNNHDLMIRSGSQLTESTMAGNIKIIQETPSTIAFEMRWSLLAVAINALLTYAFLLLQKKVIVQLDKLTIEEYGGVLVEVILILSNVITAKSLKQSASVLFGYLLSRKQGFSMVVCGYLHVHSFRKIGFAQRLSLTSTARQFLQRLSIIWIILESMLLLTPFCAVALKAEVSAAGSNDVSDCMYFVQDPIIGPVDRKWPNFEAEFGVGEYVFGSSIGYMRSEIDVPVTTAVLPPSLISPLNDGDTILGPGFSADISTTCHCALGFSPRDFAYAGVDTNQAVDVFALYNSSETDIPSITFGAVFDGTNITISNVFSAFSLCGGTKTKRSLPMVCSTTISNHQAVDAEIQFRTDGTTASIAPNIVTKVDTIGAADMSWLYFGLNSVIEGPVSHFQLPPTTPGSLNTLMWWTSPNLIAVDRALLEPGVETLYAILFKAAIQRTYSSRGSSCSRVNLLRSHASQIMTAPEGAISAFVILLVQAVVTVLTFFPFAIWFLSKHPLTPAIRATRDYVHFLTLLTNTYMQVSLAELCNAETYAIWQELDKTCRIGESIRSIEAGIGQVMMDKPSMIRSIKNGRKYM